MFNYLCNIVSDSMSVNFSASAAQAELDMGVDCGEGEKVRRSQMRWDRKRKKMVHVDPVRILYNTIMYNNTRTLYYIQIT